MQPTQGRRRLGLLGWVAGAVLIGAGAGAALAALGWLGLAAAPRPPTACLTPTDRPPAPGAGMVWIVPGRVRLGSDAYRVEEAPVRAATVAGFWMATHTITNAQFQAFVRETGYVTLAEQRPDATAEPHGALVFAAPSEIRNLGDSSQWWRLDRNANWRRPEGAGSDLTHRQQHPVVHVAHADAEAYARWAGHTLPTEAQWEHAARAGREGETYVWGNEPDTDAAPKANTWRGAFPLLNLGAKGYRGTSPVGCFPANAWGLFDMAGNVWQWTRSAWTLDHSGEASGDARAGDWAARVQAYVIKGGSFLCAPNFCMRYRPAARQPGEAGSGAAHIGFRTVLGDRTAP